jgi:hypothetical protein
LPLADAEHFRGVGYGHAFCLDPFEHPKKLFEK